MKSLSLDNVFFSSWMLYTRKLYLQFGYTLMIILFLPYTETFYKLTLDKQLLLSVSQKHYVLSLLCYVL